MTHDSPEDLHAVLDSWGVPKDTGAGTIRGRIAWLGRELVALRRNPNRMPVAIHATQRVQVANAQNQHTGKLGTVQFFDLSRGTVEVRLDSQSAGYTTQFKIEELVALIPFVLKFPE